MIRQIAVERLLVAGVAGARGWWITNWSVRTWAHATASIYQVLDYRVDAGTFAYLVAISIVAALLFSLAPIWLGAPARVRAIGTKANAIMIATTQKGLKPVELVTGRRSCPRIPAISRVMA